MRLIVGANTANHKTVNQSPVVAPIQNAWKIVTDSRPINTEVFVPMKKGRYQSILICCILLVDQWIVVIKALLVESVYILILCCVGVPAIMSVNIGTGMTPAEENRLLDLPEYEETLPPANQRHCTNTAEEAVDVPG